MKIILDQNTPILFKDLKVGDIFTIVGIECNYYMKTLDITKYDTNSILNSSITMNTVCLGPNTPGSHLHIPNCKEVKLYKNCELIIKN